LIDDFGTDRPADDFDEDEDPEWLDFKPQEKKFDFSKQVPLKKMFENDKGMELETLEDEDDMQTEDTQHMLPQDQQPISIDQIEQQTFNKHGQNMPQNMGMQQNPMQQQPSPFDQKPQDFGFPGQGQFPPFGAGGPQQMQQPGQPPQVQQFDNPMGFPGFPGQDAFGSFGQPFDNNMGMQSAFGNSMGFGDSMFGPGYGRDEEFEKIFGQPGQQQNPGGFFPPGESTEKQQQDMGGMYNFGMDQNQFMTQQEDDDEEDDWMMDEQFQNKQLDFIGQHGDTPSKDKTQMDDQVEKHFKPKDVISKSYKYVRSNKKRNKKPRRVHNFEPKIKIKKRFEKLFDKEDKDENQTRKQPQTNLNMYLIKKYWDMKDDPTKLEMLNLIQNPFSYHLCKKRSQKPQFFLNREGPIDITELFMWFNNGLIPKTAYIGHDETCYKLISRQSFLFEKFFQEYCASIVFSTSSIPDQVINKPVQNEVNTSEDEEEAIMPASQPQSTMSPHLFDPAISGIIHDDGVKLIDASQLESNLLSQAQNSMASQQPFDPAIVSYQSAHKK
jgi:hypothetical protein